MFNTRVEQKKITNSIVRNAELVEISNAVDQYDSSLIVFTVTFSRHMRTNSTSAAVQNSDPLGIRISIGSPRSYMLFVGTGYLEKTSRSS
jgi:hypothetical protein